MKLTTFICESLLIVTLAACSGFSTAPIQTSTPAPSETPSPTILWFPPTNTPTVFPTQIPVPTEGYHSGVGDLLFADAFDQPDLWSTSSSTWASASVNRSRLVLSISGQGPLSITSMRSLPTLLDFYAEATANVSLCSAKDEYGLVFRSAAGGYYRLALRCDGQVRLERGTSGSITPQTEWLASGDVPAGAPSEVKIGVWALGNKLRFYLNDRLQFDRSDPQFQAGTLGFFIFANKTTPITVSFSDLSVYSVFKVSPTLAPSTIPNP